MIPPNPETLTKTLKIRQPTGENAEVLPRHDRRRQVAEAGAAAAKRAEPGGCPFGDGDHARVVHDGRCRISAPLYSRRTPMHCRRRRDHLAGPEPRGNVIIYLGKNKQGERQRRCQCAYLLCCLSTTYFPISFPGHRERDHLIEPRIEGKN